MRPIITSNEIIKVEKLSEPEFTFLLLVFFLIFIYIFFLQCFQGPRDSYLLLVKTKKANKTNTTSYLCHICFRSKS